MNKQPTYQSHQGVKVSDANHPRFGQAGRVVDVAERDITKTVTVTKQVQKMRDADDGNGGHTQVPYWDDEDTTETVTVTVIGVRFDVDHQIEDVPLAALQALN